MKLWPICETYIDSHTVQIERVGQITFPVFATGALNKLSSWKNIILVNPVLLFLFPLDPQGPTLPSLQKMIKNYNIEIAFWN